MLKQTLLAFTVLGFAGSAAAVDITNPFFLPESLHINSDTFAGYSVQQVKNDTSNGRVYRKDLTEKLQFGILNNLAVIGEISKNWATTKDRISGFSQKDHNDLDWNAGLAWNVLDCCNNAKLQLSSVYGQKAPTVKGSYEYMDPMLSKGTYKYMDTTLKVGYQFQTFLPYASFTVHTPIAQTVVGQQASWSYNGKVGVYQGKCGVWSLDTALAWEFKRTYVHSRTLSAEAEASYYLTKNMTVGVYGSYMLVGDAKADTDLYNKAVGARVRLYF